MSLVRSGGDGIEYQLQRCDVRGLEISALGAEESSGSETICGGALAEQVIGELRLLLTSTRSERPVFARFSLVINWAGEIAN
jgi:hypothetical protein